MSKSQPWPNIYLLCFGFVGYSSVEKFWAREGESELDSERGKASEAIQYDPDRFDCRVYPVIPLVRGNMCWTCVCASQVTAQSGRQKERERERKAACPALTISSSSLRANRLKSGFSICLLREPRSVGSISVCSIWFTGRPLSSDNGSGSLNI